MRNNVRNIKYVSPVRVNLKGTSYTKSEIKCLNLPSKHKQMFINISILLWQHVSLLLDQIMTNI